MDTVFCLPYSAASQSSIRRALDPRSRLANIATARCSSCSSFCLIPEESADVIYSGLVMK